MADEREREGGRWTDEPDTDGRWKGCAGNLAAPEATSLDTEGSSMERETGACKRVSP